MMLDFTDVSQLKDFLKRDKHKLLEGMVVEDLFMRDIVFPQKWDQFTSKGWWAVEDTKGRSDYILFHVTEHPPTEADKFVYNFFVPLKVPIYHVVLSNNNLYFLELKEELLTKPINSENYINEYTFLSKNNLIKHRNVHLAVEDTRDSFSQDRAIMYFERNGILKDVALQRYFANYFLTVYFKGHIINIDSFVLFKNGLSAIEIKFKYPDKSGHYGINSGQSQLFKWLISSGINIYHYIAQNPSHNKGIGIFEVLTTHSLKSNFYWEFVQLDKNELSGTDSTAPQETSIAGDKTMSFKSIDSSKFNKLLAFPVAKGLDFSWTPHKPCPRCGSNLKVINGKFGYFLGCSNYSKCKKSQK